MIYLFQKIIGKVKSFRRKPNPGMFFEVSQKYLLRLDETFYIGDDPRDCEAAKNASCRSILIGDSIDKKKCTPIIILQGLLI